MSSFQLTAPGSNNSVLRSVPLIVRGSVTQKPVLCEGHKLIARGNACRGVSFLTKYLLSKGYRDASVLFVDWKYSFGHASTNPTDIWFGHPTTKLPAMWNNRVMPFQKIEYGAVFLEPFASVGIKWTILPLDDERQFVNFLINLLERIAQLPSTKNTRVLILEQYWFNALANSALWESLNYLLKVGRKLGIEIWLLYPSDLYDETDKESHLQRLQRLQLQFSNLFLLDHRTIIRSPFLLDVQSIWQLTPAEYSLLTSVGDNLSQSLMPYKEVFFKRCTDSEPISDVYGIKVAEEEAELF